MWCSTEQHSRQEPVPTIRQRAAVHFLSACSNAVDVESRNAYAVLVKFLQGDQCARITGDVQLRLHRFSRADVVVVHGIAHNVGTGWWRGIPRYKNRNWWSRGHLEIPWRIWQSSCKIKQSNCRYQTPSQVQQCCPLVGRSEYMPLCQIHPAPC